MLENIAYAVGTVLAVVGLVSVIYFIMLRFIRPKKDEIYYEVLVFDENEDSASLRVSFLLSQLMSTGNLRSCRILAVDKGMKPCQRKALEQAFGQEKRVMICSVSRAEEILFQ